MLGSLELPVVVPSLTSYVYLHGGTRHDEENQGIRALQLALV